MAGHNKWSKIKHKKAATDAQKSKIFGKLAKLIAVESKRANGDTNDPGLASVIERAKKENMPKDNIERAVKKGAGGEGGNEMSITYETYGPNGVAIIIEALTDNRNRTAAEIRHLLSELGYELANPGSASWAFERKGIEWIPHTTTSLDPEGETRLEALIERLEEHDDIQEIYTNAE